MDDFRAVIGLWPSRAELAADLNITYGQVKQWWRRNSIPAEYWQHLIIAAVKRGIEGLTASRLAAISARKAA